MLSLSLPSEIKTQRLKRPAFFFSFFLTAAVWRHQRCFNNISIKCKLTRKVCIGSCVLLNAHVYKLGHLRLCTTTKTTTTLPIFHVCLCVCRHSYRTEHIGRYREERERLGWYQSTMSTVIFDQSNELMENTENWHSLCDSLWQTRRNQQEQQRGSIYSSNKV